VTEPIRCLAPNPFSADLPPCGRELGHDGLHTASWDETIGEQAGLASMSWDSARLGEMRERARNAPAPQDEKRSDDGGWPSRVQTPQNDHIAQTLADRWSGPDGREEDDPT